MKYFEFIKRLATFKKYPLFRTVPFRYLLLNILLLSIFIALPFITTLTGTVNTFSNLSEVSDEIPEFVIENDEYRGAEKLLSLNEHEILFTSEITRDEADKLGDAVLFAFLRDGIYINEIQNGTFSYSFIGDIKDNESLGQFVSSQMSSLYFYIFIYITIYVVVIYFFIFTLMLFLSLLLSFIAGLMKKKTDYMNWFKIGSYIMMLLSLPIGIIAVYTETFYWVILAVALIPYIYYFKKLPGQKKTHS
ncbi:hypothetical protein GCM10007275_04720 [Jeotgalicoccus coquinae]|uniref:DUF1189 domain-containing protein n=1 Tax=Jeotgalicoccus coquinae TaxID=709509 RepID=A0A6V7RA75_9STAP|nr:DUF1189 family protein [Jeotgalicoccus coquinae]MBB6422861.1 hypothetical protein [Jeotgalicoccus coquinae]GGE12583.1 hypothetical protein GCM10007275_04720 [Jeotgalicoccus coquinae]CAD2073874.1 hypothetical protein JEOCOQ751_00819 [Jeotgalicoccus coquinae]